MIQFGRLITGAFQAALVATGGLAQFVVASIEGDPPKPRREFRFKAEFLAPGKYPGEDLLLKVLSAMGIASVVSAMAVPVATSVQQKSIPSMPPAPSNEEMP